MWDHQGCYRNTKKMKLKLKLGEGRALVGYAREVIEGHFIDEIPQPPQEFSDIFTENVGVYARLLIYPTRQLRGTFGYSEGLMPLWESIKEVATIAAFNNNRFIPLRESELKTTTVELSILSELELIKVESIDEYRKKIRVGRDGLVVEKGLAKGILLPQIAVERKWTPDEFMSRTCMRADLDPFIYVNPATKIYKFSAQIFSEVEPKGKINKINLMRRK